MGQVKYTGPDGRNHFGLMTTAGITVICWTGDGDPHPDAFVPAGLVPRMAGMGPDRLPKLTGRISRALSVFCADNVAPVARVHEYLVFPASAVLSWLESGGRAQMVAWRRPVLKVVK